MAEDCSPDCWIPFETPAEAPPPSNGARKTEAEGLALLIEAIVEVAAELDRLDRDQLADRVLQLGGYAAAGSDDWARLQTVKARFAVGLAARLVRG